MVTVDSDIVCKYHLVGVYFPQSLMPVAVIIFINFYHGMFSVVEEHSMIGLLMITI